MLKYPAVEPQTTNALYWHVRDGNINSQWTMVFPYYRLFNVILHMWLTWRHISPIQHFTIDKHRLSYILDLIYFAESQELPNSWETTNINLRNEQARDRIFRFVHSSAVHLPTTLFYDRKRNLKRLAPIDGAIQRVLHPKVHFSVQL